MDAQVVPDPDSPSNGEEPQDIWGAVLEKLQQLNSSFQAMGLEGAHTELYSFLLLLCHLSDNRATAVQRFLDVLMESDELGPREDDPPNFQLGIPAPVLAVLHARFPHPPTLETDAYGPNIYIPPLEELVNIPYFQLYFGL